MPTPRRARSVSLAGNAGRPMPAQRMAVLAASLNAAQRRQPNAAAAAAAARRRQRENAAVLNAIAQRNAAVRNAIAQRNAAVAQRNAAQATINANYKNKLLQTIKVTQALIRNSYGNNYNHTLAKVKNFISGNPVNLEKRAKNIFNAYNLMPNSRKFNIRERNNLVNILRTSENWSQIDRDTKKRIKEVMTSSLNSNTKISLLGKILDLISVYSPRHANALQNAAENYGIRQKLGRAAFLRKLGIGKGQASRIIGEARETARAARLAA
jgi:hypothetical protein